MSPQQQNKETKQYTPSDNPTPKSKADFRKLISDNFLNAINRKGLEWKKEWSGVNMAPYNAVTGKKYRGSNVLNLAFTAMLRGYTDPRWVTFEQIADRKEIYHKGEKWKLRSGSKAAYIEYYFMKDLTVTPDKTGADQKKIWYTFKEYADAINRDGRKPEDFTLCARYYSIFNASCVDGIAPLQKVELEEKFPDDLINNLSRSMGVPISFDGGDRAYYTPSKDSIHLPEAKNFYSQHALDSTALHELTHSTGHSSRLNRDLHHPFGSEGYAKEELVAEIASVFMTFDLNVPVELSGEQMNNHLAYVQSWNDIIKKDPAALENAIKAAQKAADYMETKAGLLDENVYNERYTNTMPVQTEAEKPAEAVTAKKTASL